MPNSWPTPQPARPTPRTAFPAPLILFDPSYKGKLRAGGTLADVAPTLLGMLGIEAPPEMTGHDLRVP
jgi:2,3-bisphosphoglycerate-independent phosphoglycerate mutase